jgi:ABC-2 type transport system ATP-binding protein
VSEPAITTNGLSKAFGSLVALHPLDLEMAAGEVLGYLGPNGAGKTVTIRLLLGLLRPTAGGARIFGLDSQADTADAHRHLAYVPGEASLWPALTGEETLHLLGRVHGRVDGRYRDELVERFALDPTRKVRTLSKGNRQKISLIAAFMSRAELLVLDEPTSGLDPLMEQEFRRAVLEAKDGGQAVFLSSHILSEVEALCDRIAILRAGRLVETGTMSDLRHLSALTVEVTFDGTPPDLDGVPGVSQVEIVGSLLRCQVNGPIEPLLQRLSTARVTQLLSREPSLEEIFLAHYGVSSLELGREPAAPRAGDGDDGGDDPR